MRKKGKRGREKKGAGGRVCRRRERERVEEKRGGRKR